MPIALFACAVLATVRQGRHVAITIDDLPFVGQSKQFGDVLANTQTLLAPLRAHHIPVTGFVVGSGFDAFPPAKRNQLYRCWLDSGFELGNHTWTHADFDSVQLSDYEGQIERTDDALRAVQGYVRYFRAPYLNEGKDLASKASLLQFLNDRGYTVAPVTIDSDEYIFATPYDSAVSRGDKALIARIERAYIHYMRGQIRYFELASHRVLGRECAQIYLIHANRLTANTMPELIKNFRSRGYDFVSLSAALRDPAYNLPDTYLGAGGYSWIFRWGLARGVKFDSFPQPPAWVSRAFATTQVK